MTRTVKKMAVAGLIGIMQLGSLASVQAAVLLHNRDFGQEVRLDRRDRGHDSRREHEERRRYEERKREHDRRVRVERKRHEREMRHRHNESRREWERRQEWERERHNRALREIGALLIGIVVGTRL